MEVIPDACSRTSLKPIACLPVRVCVCLLSCSFLRRSDRFPAARGPPFSHFSQSAALSTGNSSMRARAFQCQIIEGGVSVHFG